MSNVGKLQLNSLIATDISSQDISIQQNRDIITLALTLLALLKLTMKMWQPAMTIASSNMAAILCWRACHQISAALLLLLAKLKLSRIQQSCCDHCNMFYYTLRACAEWNNAVETAPMQRILPWTWCAKKPNWLLWILSEKTREYYLSFQ